MRPISKQIHPLLRRAHDSLAYRTGGRFRLFGEARFDDIYDGLDASQYTFPTMADELRNSELYKSWWYYTVELLPGVITKGIYPSDLPMLPRIMLRNCELPGMECLDLGSMEGLVPALMCRKGAKRVIATDATNHCAEKMAAVKHYYDVDFAFKELGLMYHLYNKFPSQGFDLINVSGLLYHVFSPLMVLSGIRPLLKKNGLIIVSTNVIYDDSFTMEFNNAGRMQVEGNTFWYISIRLLDYMLRYLKLAPIDCVHLSHSEMKSPSMKYSFDKPSGYVSVVCRAMNDVLPTTDDTWMAESARGSWEHNQLPNWELFNQQETSAIEYNGNAERQFYRTDVESLDLWEAVNNARPFNLAERPDDSHTLRLSDKS